MPGPTILLAEDDDMVRSFVCSILQSHGYRVLPADNGMEAMRLADLVGVNRIDLVLTDIEMPALSGLQLARHLKRLRPGLKVLYMTGHRYVLVDELEAEGLVIEKPFAYSTLVRQVEACLSEELREDEVQSGRTRPSLSV